jgi:hypothetical protein
LTLPLSLFFFSGSYLGVFFWKFCKERQGSLDGPSSLKWYLLPHQRL